MEAGTAATGQQEATQSTRSLLSAFVIGFASREEDPLCEEFNAQKAFEAL
jgi:hypothetical protein